MVKLLKFIAIIIAFSRTAELSFYQWIKEIYPIILGRLCNTMTKRSFQLFNWSGPTEITNFPGKKILKRHFYRISHYSTEMLTSNSEKIKT